MSDTDLQLLARYTRHHADDAFAEIVRRHLDLVHSAAFRQVRSPQLAEEVAQSAFTDLARNAHRLAPDTILTAWLYRVTRRTAIDAVRRESRRQLREQIATEMNAMNATADDWTHIEPLLDEAMHALDETDRAAVLLRYFENKSLREVGETLGASEDAARKRISRAVERLREFFAKRGLTVGAGGLAVVISANAVQAAPVGLAMTISTAVALAGTTLTTTTAIVMTTLQKTVIAATLVAAVGTGIYEARQASTARAEVQTLKQQQAPLAEQIQQLQRERDDATNRLAGSQNEIARLNKNSGELSKLRGESTRLRADAKELARSIIAQRDFLNSTLVSTKEVLTNAALSRVEKMKKELGLNADQEANMKNILLVSIEPEVQVEAGSLAGTQSDEETLNQLNSLRADKESKLVALLTPEQRLAYEEMKKQQAAIDAANFANQETSSMKSYLNLSQEQAEAVSSILASLPPGQGGSGEASDPNAKVQLEARLQVLAQTLTPAQLQAIAKRAWLRSNVSRRTSACSSRL